MGAGAGVGLGVGAATAAGFALKGLTIGSVAGPIGTLIGAGIGLVAGLIVSGVTAAVTNDAEEREAKLLDELADVSQEDRDSIFAAAASKNVDRLKEALTDANIDLNDSKLINSLMENAGNTKELVDEMAKNNELIKANRATAMGSYLQSGRAGEEIAQRYNNSIY
jgi:hypothetical protein